MEYIIERIDKGKDIYRNTIWNKTDITNTVVMPFIDVIRQDRALDTSSLSVINTDKEPIKPFTRFIIRIKKSETEIENLYRVVLTDSVQLIRYGQNKEYRHNLELVESTKILERYVVDNMTITNLLAFLYDDTPDWIISENTPNVETTFVTGQEQGFDVLSVGEYGYTDPNNKYLTDYSLNTAISTLLPYTITIISSFPSRSFTAQVADGTYGNVDTSTITTPSGQVINLCDSTGHLLTQYYNYRLTEEGEYIFTRKYVGLQIIGTKRDEIYVTVTWKFRAIKKPDIPPKKPTKYNIKQVINRLLRRFGEYSTVLRERETPLFKLDPNLDFLDTIDSPEFTFTQNTLFGVLEQIGNYIHAIPRLIPSNPNKDWENWTTITYDFLGKRAKKNDMSDYKLISADGQYNGENYTSQFICDIQNSFQTNNVEFISMVEPYEGGFISARTEDGNFEISNDNAVIKTSRPIQRIVSLEVGVKSGEDDVRTIDITKYVKEQTDYNLLVDYARNEIALTERQAKSTAIYYTRGSNVIGGLTYYPPKKLNIQYLATNRAIENIINLAGGYNIATSWQIKDLMFRIKYVPIYNFKAMQFKPYLENDCGDNMLFYNQQQSQQVDIESLGENIRGALMMTANKELELTGYITGDPNKREVKAGDMVIENYYAYQINREFINNKSIKTTVTLSKDFNKWNEYVAIKKNFREWEISNRESYVSNPTYNEFVIVDDKFDGEELLKLLIDQYTWKNEQGEVVYVDEEAINEEMVDFDSKLELGGGFTATQSGGFVFENITGGGMRWANCEFEAYNPSTQQTEIFKCTIPCSCFSFGNSIVINFATADNYSAGTTSKQENQKTYALENYVKYCNKYGHSETVRVSIGNLNALRVSTHNIPSISAPSGYSQLSIASKLLNLNETKEPINEYGEYILPVEVGFINYTTRGGFVIDKDSRQSISLTIQLNFVSTNKDVWVYPAMAKYNPLVGDMGNKTFKVYGFTKEPNRISGIFDNAEELGCSISINNEMKPSKNYVHINSYHSSSAIEFKENGQPAVSHGDYVGIGIAVNIDKKQELVLYYNKELKNGDLINPLYIMNRRKI